ncbi:capsular polysaccharide synthesis protein [Streptococcus suis]|uniref:capsular polysaccharide synthesis protein n=1 Tax=Streptococcus suis TaxID=1307 RepID=UPI001C96F0DC|nr:capsular polysaccharide synthesis protein [Streptococcus suis]
MIRNVGKFMTVFRQSPSMALFKVLTKFGAEETIKPDSFLGMQLSRLKWRAHSRFYEKTVTRHLSPFSAYLENDNTADSLTPIIWTLWWQGESELPAVCRHAIESQKRFAQKNGYQHIFLTKDNLADYLAIPEILLEKMSRKKMAFTPFSNYVRYALLAQHGGVWMDATLYVTDQLDSHLFANDFFAFQHQIESVRNYYLYWIEQGRWTSFCFSAKKGNPHVCYIRDCLLYYFSQVDNPINYTIDLFQDIHYRLHPEFREVIDYLPIVSGIENRDFVSVHFNEPFDEKRWQEVLETSPIVKFSWKFYRKSILDGSYADMIYRPFFPNTKENNED